MYSYTLSTGIITGPSVFVPSGRARSFIHHNSGVANLNKHSIPNRHYYIIFLVWRNPVNCGTNEEVNRTIVDDSVCSAPVLTCPINTCIVHGNFPPPPSINSNRPIPKSSFVPESAQDFN